MRIHQFCENRMFIFITIYDCYFIVSCVRVFTNAHFWRFMIIKKPRHCVGAFDISRPVVLGQSGDAVGSGEGELRAVGDDHIGVEGVEQRPAEDDVGDGVVPDRCPCGDATA